MKSYANDIMNTTRVKRALLLQALVFGTLSVSAFIMSAAGLFLALNCVK